MCLSAGAITALSLLGTVGSTALQNQQQKSQMKRYNNEVAAQNKLLSDQFTDRQRKIDAAKTEQGRVFNELSAQQNEDFAKQTELAKRKAQAFEESAKKPVLTGADSPEFAEAVARRNQLYEDTGAGFTPDFGASNDDSTENRVLRQAGEALMAKEKERTSGMADALARISAAGDVNQVQNQLFRDIGVGQRDVASEAEAASRLAQFKARQPQYRMGALGAAAGEQAQMPFFRGQEPIFRPADTTFADILGGASRLGSIYAFRQPGPFPWQTAGNVNPQGGFY